MKVTFNEEASQVETSWVERWLALAMVVFLLVGGAWVFRELQSVPSRPNYADIESRYISEELRNQHTLAQEAYWTANRSYQQTVEKYNHTYQEYEFRREEYRVMLERNIDDPVRFRAYNDALAAYEAAQLSRQVASQVEERASSALRATQALMDQAYTKISADYDSLRHSFEWKLFGLRISYSLPVFLLALLVFTRMRRQGSNYLIFGTALVSFSSLQLLYLVALYSWHLLRDVAQIAISLIGTALCIAGIVVIRRYLIDPVRIAKSRLRKGLCPACATPAGDNLFCCSCGEALKHKCSSCGLHRPVRAEFCPHCGTK